MDAYLLIQKNNADTHWTSLYIRGIKLEAKSRGYDLICGESDGETLPPEFESAPVVLCAGASFGWMKLVTEMLRFRGKKAVLVGCAHQNGIIASGFSVADYELATFDVLNYFYRYNKKRVALLGINSDSAADLLKMKAFLNYKHGVFGYDDVFFFRGQTRNVCESLIPLISSYDAVISANDVTGLMLVKTLEKAGVKIPEDLFVASFGDMTYRSNLSSQLTVAVLDSVKVGRKAVSIYADVSADPSLSYITIKNRCEIDIRRSTDVLPFDVAPEAPEKRTPPPFDLYADAPLTDMMLAEQIFSDCDALDLEILLWIQKGKKNADVAEMLHTSESTVKYRIKRMLNRAHLASRKELMTIMSAYLR